MSDIMQTLKFKGREMQMSEFLTLVLGTLPTEKIALSFDTFKNYILENDAFVEEDKFRQDLLQLSCPEKFNSFILKTATPGIQIREFLKGVLEKHNLAFAQNIHEKIHYIALVSSLFDFGTEEQAQEPQPEAASSIEEETLTTATAPVPHVHPSYTVADLQKVLQNASLEPTKECDNIDVSNKITLIEGMDVTALNDFSLTGNFSCFKDCIAIAADDDSNQVVAIGHLQDFEDSKHVILASEDINFRHFKNFIKFNIILFPPEFEQYYVSDSLQDYKGKAYKVSCNIKLEELKTTTKTLCIDFGTSNTTAGSYGLLGKSPSAIEIVEFLDETGDTPKVKQMLPTVVYVQACASKDIKYLFGYDALKKVKDQDYNPDATVFYEIKRWVNNMDGQEDISDDAGNSNKVTHRAIIKAYLDHIIDAAEKHFRVRFQNLHFTAPIKLKNSFIEEMYKLFRDEGRNVLPAGASIDEGIAIIYNHIANRMASAEEITNESVLIMDCGGGTTDLASCDYSVATIDGSKRLSINTKFENGDSNFGGNNITFRILQLLKIKLADKLEQERAGTLGEIITAQKLIMNETNILGHIDEIAAQEVTVGGSKFANVLAAKDDVYGEFDKKYEDAEKLVPTCFARATKAREEKRLKRNFYYLWQLAEAYKVAFYKSTELVSVDFNAREDQEIGIPDISQYYLYVRKDGKSLEKLDNPFKNIKLTNNELKCLLYADIYTLLYNVLQNYEGSLQNLQDFDFYKLSGQSCTIMLFNELLKEFIPGKYLRREGKNNVQAESHALKLECITGSILYMRDMESGNIEPVISLQEPRLIYDVFMENPGSNESLPMLLRDGSVTIMPRPQNTQHALFSIKDANGVEKYSTAFDFGYAICDEKNIPLNRLYQRIMDDAMPMEKPKGRSIAQSIWENLNNIDSGDCRFLLFLVPAKNGYGFYIYQVLVEIDQSDSPVFSLVRHPYRSFENETLKTLFDGYR